MCCCGKGQVVVAKVPGRRRRVAMEKKRGTMQAQQCMPFWHTTVFWSLEKRDTLMGHGREENGHHHRQRACKAGINTWCSVGVAKLGIQQRNKEKFKLPPRTKVIHYHYHFINYHLPLK